MTKTIRRILVAVDLSEPRDAAFDRALLLARGWNAELYLLHTRPPQPVSRFAITGEDLEPARREAERSHLRALVRSAKDEGVQVRVISAHGDPARAIAAHAHLVMADLIVVARDFGSSRIWRTSARCGDRRPIRARPGAHCAVAEGCTLPRCDAVQEGCRRSGLHGGVGRRIASGHRRHRTGRWTRHGRSRPVVCVADGVLRRRGIRRDR